MGPKLLEKINTTGIPIRIARKVHEEFAGSFYAAFTAQKVRNGKYD
jgi:hypothetical protein